MLGRRAHYKYAERTDKPGVYRVAARPPAKGGALLREIRRQACKKGAARAPNVCQLAYSTGIC